MSSLLDRLPPEARAQVWVAARLYRAGCPRDERLHRALTRVSMPEPLREQVLQVIRDSRFTAPQMIVNDLKLHDLELSDKQIKGVADALAGIAAEEAKLRCAQWEATLTAELPKDFFANMAKGDPAKILSEHARALGQETPERLISDALGLSITGLRSSLGEGLGAAVAQVTGAKRKASAAAPEKVTPSVETPKVLSRVERVAAVIERMSTAIGLAEPKARFRTFVEGILFKQLRKCMNIPEDPQQRTTHMVFVGPPGVFKSSLAYNIGDACREVGLLKKGHVVVALPRDLIAEYEGQTPTKTGKKVEEALDGVLVLEEFYGVMDSKYGQQVIDTVMALMEMYRGRLIVIPIGYPDLMKKCLDANPGFRDRFGEENIVHFPAYNIDELAQILALFCKNGHFTIDVDAASRAREYIAEAMKNPKFANGRTVRNLYEKWTSNLERRVLDKLGKGETPSADEMTRLTLADITQPKVTEL